MQINFQRISHFVLFRLLLLWHQMLLPSSASVHSIHPVSLTGYPRRFWGRVHGVDFVPCASPVSSRHSCCCPGSSFLAARSAWVVSILRFCLCANGKGGRRWNATIYNHKISITDTGGQRLPVEYHRTVRRVVQGEFLQCGWAGVPVQRRVYLQ